MSKAQRVEWEWVRKMLIEYQFNISFHKWYYCKLKDNINKFYPLAIKNKTKILGTEPH